MKLAAAFAAILMAAATAVSAAEPAAQTPPPAAPPAYAPPPATPRVAFTDYTFLSGEIALSGRLYKPAGPGPFPTVIYAHGGGDYTLMADPYAINTAQAFVDRGMAVFVFDKRGVGKSGGKFQSGGNSDKARDIRAALDFASTLPEVDGRRLGLWTISQSAWLAPAAVFGREDVKFLIMISPGGVKPIELMYYYLDRELRALPETDRKAAVQLWGALSRYYGLGEGRTEAQTLLDAAQGKPWLATVKATAWWEGLPSEGQVLTPTALREAWKATPDLFAWINEREHYLAYDDDYRALTHPVLVVFGGADTLIPLPDAQRILGASLAQHPDATIRTFPETGHGIQRRGDATNPSPEYLKLMTDWALVRFGQS